MSNYNYTTFILLLKYFTEQLSFHPYFYKYCDECKNVINFLISVIVFICHGHYGANHENLTNWDSYIFSRRNEVQRKS